MRASHAAALALALGLAACEAAEPTTTTPPEALHPTLAPPPPADPTPGTITLEKIGAFDGGGTAAAEIVAYDHVSGRLFVVNGAHGTVDVLDLSDPTRPASIATIPAGQFGASANSVAAHDGVVAVAIEGHVRTAPGTVVLYRAASLQLISAVPVGALPDMVAFTPSGRYLLVANEGEPSDDYSIDPEGSVSVVDVTNPERPTVRTAGFGAVDGQREQLRAEGVRIFGPNASVARDLEPEYVAIDASGTTAWVTLQENNALAVVDIASATVTDLIPLGFKDHRLAGNGLDASDRDGGTVANIRPWPVLGMYQPDAIAAYAANGVTYLVTANEGDARDYPGFGEEVRAGSLPLDPGTFADAACGGPCRESSRLGRLNVTRTLGLDPGTGLYTALYAFGARSISIWTAGGAPVWDSGDELERRTAALPMANFNAGNTNNTFDDRSDNKGPEPEGLALATLGTKTFAFVGLERIGGVAVYDVTHPYAPFFVTYVNTRQGVSGDLGPEGLTFVPATRSPSQRPLLIVGNEVSGTTAVFQVHLH